MSSKKKQGETVQRGRPPAAILGMAGLVLTAAWVQAADYRGMPAGWPAYGPPTTTAVSYPSPPRVGMGYTAPAAPRGQVVYFLPVASSMQVPGTMPYGQGATVLATAASRPAPLVAYLPVASGSAPGNAYVASSYAAPARYASYAVTPAGLSSAGSEAAAYYGQPTPLNYVPPQFVYRTTYAAVPVYLYRPVTVYDPVTAQPTTCLQPSVTTQCQPQRHRWFSWLHPSTWFGRGGCGPSGCQPQAATTTYCVSGSCQPAASTCATTGCGQPYYPTQPAAPALPAPSTTVTPPATTIPAIPRGTIIPPAGTTIPPPPTRVPAGAGGLSPADLPPRLTPGTTITPAPSGSFTPAPGGSTPLPGTAPPASGQPPATVPGGSFPTTPSTAPPGGFGTGSFGSGASYVPPSHVLRSQDRPATVETRVDSRLQRPSRDELDVIRAPELAPALPDGVRTLPDLDAPAKSPPVRGAPLLLDPRDKTAVLRSDPRWAVVPARWPTRPATAVEASTPDRSPPRTLSATSRLALRQEAAMRPVAFADPQDRGGPSLQTVSGERAHAVEYDDRGWRPAAGF